MMLAKQVDSKYYFLIKLINLEQQKMGQTNKIPNRHDGK